MKLRSSKPLSTVAWLSIAALALFLPAAPSLAADPAPAPGREPRLFQQFFTDAAMGGQWYEVQMHILSGAVPPMANADGYAIGPVIAISPLKNLEIGGRVFLMDYDLDNAIPETRNRSSFDGESGLSDLDLFGKYRVLDDQVKIAVGACLTLPTGSEDDGLGTGKFVPSVFGAFRGDLGNTIGTFTGVAHLGFRFNQDADILGLPLDGKTSVFLGAGFIVKLTENLNWTGELNVESERFDVQPTGLDEDRLPVGGIHSDIRATGGIQWSFAGHSMLRGAASLGLADASPDFELFGSYVYRF